MAAGTGGVVAPLGHERDRLALQLRDLLAGVLDDDVVVGHGHGVGVADVDLFLARAPFTLGVFHGNAGCLQVLADRPQHRLFTGGLEDVVVLDVMAGGFRFVIVALVDHLVALIEQIELEFRGKHAGIAALAQALDLLFQNRPRAVGQVLAMVMIEHVAQHQRRALKPGHAPQGGHVGLEHEIAVALAPAGRGVTRHRFHVDVVGQQVIAAVGFFMAAVDEKLDLEALADQASLHVDHADQYGIDFAGSRGALECIKAEEGLGHHGNPA
ncbi:hypothetical protein D3C84_559770 [compost metagenome]